MMSYIFDAAERISTGVHKLFSQLMEGFFTHIHTNAHTNMEQQRRNYSVVSAGVQLEIFNSSSKTKTYQVW